MPTYCPRTKAKALAQRCFGICAAWGATHADRHLGGRRVGGPFLSALWLRSRLARTQDRAAPDLLDRARAPDRDLGGAGQSAFLERLFLDEELTEFRELLVLFRFSQQSSAHCGGRRRRRQTPKTDCLLLVVRAEFVFAGHGRCSPRDRVAVRQSRTRGRRFDCYWDARTSIMSCCSRSLRGTRICARRMHSSRAPT